MTVQMWDEIGRVDAKASTLIAIIGAAFAVTLAALGGSESIPWPTLVLGTVGLAFFAGSVIILVLTIRPKLVRQMDSVTTRSFAYYARATPGELHQEFSCSEETDFENICGRLNVYAQLAGAKYTKLRLAVDLLAVGLLATFCAGAYSLF